MNSRKSLFTLSAVRTSWLLGMALTPPVSEKALRNMVCSRENGMNRPRKWMPPSWMKWSSSRDCEEGRKWCMTIPSSGNVSFRSL